MKAPNFFKIFVVWAFAPLSACTPLPAQHQNRASLQYITLEEHFDPLAVLPYQTDPIRGPGNSTTPLLRDINGSRLESMDYNGIRVQVISDRATPLALDKPDVVRAANHELAAAIFLNPKRFRGFCMLPMAFPQAVANELLHCVTQLGFLGALVDSHLGNNTSYDSPAYDSLWKTLSRLDVPLYLHPTYPPFREVSDQDGLYAPSNNSYSAATAANLATGAWGLHSDTGVQFLKLWLTGVFDRFPELKVVLGHMGEMLPYMLARADSRLSAIKPDGAGLLETFSQNVWVTTSGFFSLTPFATVLETTARDRIMFSVDYPFSKNEEGRKFMEAMRESGWFTEEEWDGIALRNAEMLLKMS